MTLANKVWVISATLSVALLLTAGLTACSTGGTTASKQAQKQSNQLQGQIYQSQHDIEFNNYNLRQRMADDPSTILWCTFAFPNTGLQPITVPIAGKLTSSNKRPYDDHVYTQDYGAEELPGPDHMFGSSSEYRYGFDPTRTIYYDFTGLPSFCTNTPLVWQKNETHIVVETAATLGSIDKAAQSALKAGDAKKALEILKGAESK